MRSFSILDWFAGHPVAANLLLLVILAGGLSSAVVVDRMVYPPTALDKIEIVLHYPGASSGEVEQSICIPIEQALRDLSGIKKLESRADFSHCTVTVDVVPGYPTEELLLSAKLRVDAIKTFPSKVENLVIRERYDDLLAIILTLHGEADLLTLKRWQEQVWDDLLKLPEVGRIEIYPERFYEVAVEVDETTLRRYGLSFTEIAEAIQEASLNLPGGEIRGPETEFLLRTLNQAHDEPDFAAITLRSAVDGSRLRLGDIAKIRDGLAEPPILNHFDGQPGFALQVFPAESITAASQAVIEYAEKLQSRLPEGVKVSTWDDWSRYFWVRLEILLKNALSAFLMVYLTLFLFLRAQLALWTSVGIAVAFMGAVWMMPYLGISLNMYSMSAFILVLGIVVDDSIVIGENIYACQSRQASPLAAAVKGVQEMAPLVILMVLTTVVAFLPALFLPGVGGRLLFGVAAVIVLTLLFSLVEALLILPAHLASAPAPPSTSPKEKRGWAAVQEVAQRGLQGLIERAYVPLLDLSLRWRYVALALFCTLLLITAAWVASGKVPRAFQPTVADYYVLASLDTPAGTPFAETRRQVAQLERAIEGLRAEWKTQGDDPVRHTRTMVTGNGSFVLLELEMNETVRASMPDLVREWRKRTGAMPPGTDLSFTYTFPFNVGVQTGKTPKAIEFELTAPDVGSLQASGEWLRTQLAEIPGVHSLGLSLKPGKPEIRLRLKPEAAFLGLTQRQLSEQVQQAFYGLEAQRFLRGREEVKVMVRYPEAERRSLDDLKRMPVQLPDGREVPLAVVAELEYQGGFASIVRYNRERVQRVSAEVDPALADADSIIAHVQANILPQLKAHYPGVEARLGELRREQGEAVLQLGRNALFALVLIYALLAVALRSYMQPLLVMLAVPFGFVGSVWAHYFLAIPLTLDSLVALVAVAGVVVNTSLVLVAYINRQRQENRSIIAVVKEAGARRFRPILLTALTTFMGLSPILLEQGMEADYIKPMAVSLAFGVLFSTLVTLFVVPLCYAALEDIHGISRSRRRRSNAGSLRKFYSSQRPSGLESTSKSRG